MLFILRRGENGQVVNQTIGIVSTISSIGTFDALFNRANAEYRKHVATHAYSCFTLRFYLRMAIWLGSWPYFACFKEHVIRNAAHVSRSRSHDF